MPKGPNGQHRPADAIGCAIMVGKIATGDVEDGKEFPREPKGVRGGKARAEILSPKERSNIAQAAAKARWSVL